MRAYDLIMPISTLLIVFGAVVMLGWIGGVAPLTMPIPGGPVMKFPSALVILLGGVLLRAFYRIVNGEKQGDSMTRIMSVSVLLFIIVTPLIGGYFWEIPLGLDQLFEPALLSNDLTKTVVPSIGTISCIFLLFIISFAVSMGYRISKAVKWGGLLLLGISGIALLGYLINAPSLYYLGGKSTGMASHTALAFFLVGACFLIINWKIRRTEKPSATGDETHAPAK